MALDHDPHSHLSPEMRRSASATAEDRSPLLNRLHQLLRTGEDRSSLLGSLACLLVDSLADRCTIELAGPVGLSAPVTAVRHDNAGSDGIALSTPSAPSSPGSSCSDGRSSSADLPSSSDGTGADGLKGVPSQAKLSSCCSVRMAWQGDVLGTITVERAEDKPFSVEERGVLEEIASRTALVLDNMWLRERERRAAAERSRWEESARLQSILLDAVDEAVIATDLDGIIIYWNRFAEKLYGWRADEVAGRPVTEVTPSHSSMEMATEILQRLKRGESWSGEILLKRRDGSSFLGFVTNSPITDERGELIGVVGISTNITRRNQIQSDLKDRTEALEIVNQIGQMLAAELDLQKLVQAVTDASTELAGARFGSFFYNLIDERGATYMLYTLSGVPRHAFSNFPMPRATEMFGPTFRGEGVLRIDDVKKDPRYGKNAPYYGMPEGHLPVTSYLAVPVISRSGEVIGGLFFGHPEPGVFSEQVERIIVGIAAQTAIAMDNARLYTAAQREIEERRRTEQELQHAMETVRAANSAKDQFLATLSHELRTPLTPVLATIGMLEEDPALPAELKPFIDIIHRNIELEARLIDDLLDLTRITKGKLQLNLETLDAHPLIHNVIAICAEEIQEKKIFITTDLSAARHHVHADSARLQQVFWNLLKNAVKFTPEGGSVTVSSGNDEDGRLRVDVADNGIGIDPELLPRIFNAFEQGEEGITRQFGGLGLGLAISHRLVEMHGGRISAWSEGKGKGARLTVVIDTVG